MPRLIAFIFPALVGVCAAAGIPEAELIQPATPARLAAIGAAAQRDGWAPQIAGLRAAAIRAYELDKLTAAESWSHVYRWSALFGQTEAQFLPGWIQAIEAARVAHPNMPHRYETRNVPLGAAIAPEMQAWLLGNAAFANEFFAVLSPLDYLPGVFRILNELYGRDPARFRTYANLALAIAVVYDVPPPPDWPHGQVTEEALPRKFPPPAEAFAWWIHQEQLGRTFHRLTRLGADELKFVVDSAAPFAELDTAGRLADYPLNQLARAYTMVRYRVDRLTGNNPVWPGRTYKLTEILAAGGICVDQAYFAAEVGKARGVPTLIFRGSGNDGRHAWFGFLDGNNKWQLDAGRYAEQRFVTGLARDPQTWSELSDHELQFLSERFRSLPSYHQSRVHAAFAAEYLAQRDASAAVQAARKATGYERRNLPAWEILAAALEQQGAEPKVREAALREAILVFQHRYPDLEMRFTNRLVASLRTRGETSAANLEENNLGQRYQSERMDLSIQQAAQILARSFATQSIPEQVQAYQAVMDKFGRGAGMAFFDKVVVVFAEHLVQLGQNAEAGRAVAQARQTLKVESGSQLDAELKGLAERVKK